MGTLYVVATPIGNLEDITQRALRVLRQVPLIAAEDTRTVRKLLSHYQISTRVTSYDQHNHAKKAPLVLQALGQGDVALVSDAGMPGISDPGQALVAEAARQGAPVVVVPGPSAVVAALAASGFPSDRFTFLGFLPRRSAERRRLLEQMAAFPWPLVCFEAPHRVRASLADIAAAVGDRSLAVCRELTKLYEEVFRGTAAQARDHFVQPRGEFTLVISGAPQAPDSGVGAGWDQERLTDELARLRGQGATARDAVAQVVQLSGLPRRTVYSAWVRVSQGRQGRRRPASRRSG
ncbi:MAG: 16S rRNA (cytidine(1402)-2'-O)-methyltransferase [Chloroflexi bacterium]|nr:16S rRNA (cytidine(1402)-2'-O)-methyltransferase [Chloroflexota bacterium]